MVLSGQILSGATARELSAYGIIAMVTLAILLVSKGLANASGSSRFKLLSRHLDVGIIPLSIVFLFILGVKIAEIID
jgi:hypothetical protein